ncbi:hypothetical protein NUACC26_087210 [Scytonema sp. NUACC26]
MYFLSDVVEFKRGRDKKKRKVKSLSVNREQIKNAKDSVETGLKPIQTGQKIWSTVNHTSREIRSWKKILGL